MKSIIKKSSGTFNYWSLMHYSFSVSLVNINSCWKPYENTVIDKLKNNHNIGCEFVNSRDASLGIVDGTYYEMR